VRLWSGRFNQSATLAAKISRLQGIPHDPFALFRIRSTASQVGLSAKQRARNVAGAFRVSDSARGRVADRRILLIEDVITTGVTANACARTLKRAGAAHVDVLALARVVDPLTTSL
jgi:predicted amidophosphoribosyltransferase